MQLQLVPDLSCFLKCDAVIYQLQFSAGGIDFLVINNQQLGPFSQTQRRQCIAVTIIQNDHCDNSPNKVFALVLSQSGTQLRDTTVITIDDTNEPECRKYILSLHTYICMSSSHMLPHLHLMCFYFIAEKKVSKLN